MESDKIWNKIFNFEILWPENIDYEKWPRDATPPTVIFGSWDYYTTPIKIVLDYLGFFELFVLFHSSLIQFLT